MSFAGLSSSFMRRLLSAIVLIPLVFGVIWFGSWGFGAFVGVIAGLALREFVRLSWHSKNRWLQIAFGILYIGVGALLFYHLREYFGFWHTLLFFIAMWCSDSMAYFCGKTFGGAKMSPVLSPNKTWSGYVGALLGPVVILALAGMRIDFVILFGGMALGIAGQAGDLLISMLKRDAHMKDTGTLIPGHGGVLDRIDSLLMAVSVYLALIKLGGVF